MTLNNRERKILYKIRKNYLINIHSKNKNSITKIESAIMAIEMFNRNCIWRTAEYMFLFIYSVRYLFTKKMDNLSIGRYQLKLSYILDYLKFQYSISERNITLIDTNFFPFFKIFHNRNNSEILYSLITSERFKITPNTDIISPEIKYFIEEYSRTLATDVGFTYYFVFIYTIKNNQDI